ncbi:NAD(P)-dependent oxidoreductase [Actinophytocola sp. S1-96]|uniref:NAD(P)-dependent oxidoreductase n=2 Tax=Actinophytocola gossypii TaxID=2812003 RepID=A0ABT2JH76_9PSEU|nr:NAD(P)-dependent oxidoreductase [Actinophytocola gossypii]
MGSALAAALADAGHPTTVWNRTPGRAPGLAVTRAATVRDAVTAHPIVVACLLRHDSVHETLAPVVDDLRGRTLVNLTTTTPNEARELATWATGHGIRYLDGAIMATPPMIGSREGQVFYSGSAAAFDACRPVFDVWATSEFHGEDAGMASLLDLAMLSAMYGMFAGLTHGAAMAGSAGVRATDFAVRAIPFVGAMTAHFARSAEIIDGGDYTVPGQSLDFSDLGHIVQASEEQGVDPATIVAVQGLIDQQVAAGHGAEVFERIYESLRAPDRAVAR